MIFDLSLDVNSDWTDELTASLIRAKTKEKRSFKTL